MNLYLHGIGGDETNITVDDSLRAHTGVNYDLVLTNPPFGRKSSLTFVNSEGETERESLTVERPDFWATTSNKQLNFLQHVRTLLKTNGRAAIVLPDNVLFEGGAGETVRRRLLAECDAHTLLRLPTGIFYAQGVKANVLFFDRKPASETPWTRELWIYDLRTNRRFTLKTNPLTRTDLDDFVSRYNPDNRHRRKETERFRRFAYDDLVKRDKANLDIFWLRDERHGGHRRPPPAQRHRRRNPGGTSAPPSSSWRRLRGTWRRNPDLVQEGLWFRMILLREDSKHLAPRSCSIMPT